MPAINNATSARNPRGRNATGANNRGVIPQGGLSAHPQLPAGLGNIDDYLLKANLHEAFFGASQSHVAGQARVYACVACDQRYEIYGHDNHRENRIQHALGHVDEWPTRLKELLEAKFGKDLEDPMVLLATALRI